MNETNAWSTSCRVSPPELVDPWIARFNERCDRFEHDLLELIDRRLRAQTWLTLATVIPATAVIVAAVRL
jgi:hypothetical protein